MNCLGKNLLLDKRGLAGLENIASQNYILYSAVSQIIYCIIKCGLVVDKSGVYYPLAAGPRESEPAPYVDISNNPYLHTHSLIFSLLRRSRSVRICSYICLAGSTSVGSSQANLSSIFLNA